MAELIKGDFSTEMKSRYLTYAMSTITSRALPDVRDGLKPVHRRILYAMKLQRLEPNTSHKKSARIVGDVIGKYHPHGDVAVYDAMVRLSQDFAVRYPLIDGQGNFGSMDGDSAAAMRYTEARLTKVASYLMKDLDLNTVDFRPNYDESEFEPIVMPAAFPNLLANGTTGIAVGMSTSIPPHNITNISDCLLSLLKNPDVSIDKLIGQIMAPDFPNGGIIVSDQEEIKQAYITGRGSFRLRAKWHKEELPRGLYQIVITQLPYQVNKQKLIEKIAELIINKKMPWVTNIQDESAEDVRITIEPKTKSIDAEVLMESLFKTTDLESRIHMNMNVIDKGAPKLMNLQQVLVSYLDHRREVLIRKSNFRLDKINARLHILDAYKIVFLNIDEVIEIIKKEDEPKPIMMKRFNIDDIQAEAILNMRLRRLRKLEEMEINQEYNQLSDEKNILQLILSEHSEQTKILISDVKELKKEFGDDRRTELKEAPTVELDSLDEIEKEPLTVLISSLGWIKAIKGHIDPTQEVKYKEGDSELFRLQAMSTDNICFLGSSGRVYTISASKLPAGRGFGEPLTVILDMQNKETICSAIIHNSNDQYIITSKMGLAFVVSADDLLSYIKSGKQVLNLNKGDSAFKLTKIKGDQIAILNNKLLVFPIVELPGRAKGKGVKLSSAKIALKDITTFTNNLKLVAENTDRTKVFTLNELNMWQGKRSQAGKLPPFGYQKGAYFGELEESEAHITKIEIKTDDDETEKTKVQNEEINELLKAVVSDKKSNPQSLLDLLDLDDDE